MRILSMTFLAMISLAALPARAETLPTPQGDVVLTVTGDIGVTNAEDAARFDMAMLEAMDTTSFSTSTLWTEGERAFAGVALADILDVLGVEGGKILATAINDYTVEIPVESVTEEAPILAYSLDGKRMPRRRKGPLWLVYPYDSDAAFRSEVVYSRSIWQLTRIEIVN